MPHSKCSRCRARVWCDDHAAALCPGCGDVLEVVSDLSQLVGLRALRVRPRVAHRDSDDQFERISQRIRDTIAAHDAERRRRSNVDRA